MKFLKYLLIISLLITTSYSLDSINFVLKDNKGKTYHVESSAKLLDIKELRGKVVYLAFFGHRCPPCMMEVSGFIEFTKNKEYAKKAKILAVEVQGLSSEQLEDFIHMKDINYSVVAGRDVGSFITHIGMRTRWNNGIPFMVAINDKGRVVDFGNGIVSNEELISMTDNILKHSKKKENTNTTKEK